MILSKAQRRELINFIVRGYQRQTAQKDRKTYIYKNT